VFAHPEPARLDGVVDRLVAGDLRATDRAEFVARALASSPGSLAVADDRVAAVRSEVLDASSWVGRAVDGWTDAAGAIGDRAPETAFGVEAGRAVPGTPGWGRQRDPDGGKD
jgi:hypothetical protein